MACGCSKALGASAEFGFSASTDKGVSTSSSYSWGGGGSGGDSAQPAAPSADPMAAAEAARQEALRRQQQQQMAAAAQRVAAAQLPKFSLLPTRTTASPTWRKLSPFAAKTSATAPSSVGQPDGVPWLYVGIGVGVLAVAYALTRKRSK